MSIIQPGTLFITARLSEEIEREPVLQGAVIAAVAKYDRANWGDTHPDDKPLNDAALKTREDRIIAKYKMPEPFEDIFIITYFDEPSMNSDVTTVMFCSDY